MRLYRKINFKKIDNNNNLGKITRAGSENLQSSAWLEHQSHH